MSVWGQKAVVVATVLKSQGIGLFSAETEGEKQILKPHIRIPVRLEGENILDPTVVNRISSPDSRQPSIFQFCFLSSLLK